MPVSGCSCGFTETADETITDHLLAAFTPPDNRGADGRVHEERQRGRCLCGLVADATGLLDDHFLTVFTPGAPNARGRDGGTHERAGSVLFGYWPVAVSFSAIIAENNTATRE